jgi:2-hydroxychromene-2-carboxylate isomerase
MVPAPIAFYFDFSSPYSYIASEWIEALAARHGRTVRWHAILLGVTFQAAELTSPVDHPIKRDYAMHDFERSARFEGVPLRIPEKFPIPTAERRAHLLVAERRAAGVRHRVGPPLPAGLLRARLSTCPALNCCAGWRASSASTPTMRKACGATRPGRRG